MKIYGIIYKIENLVNGKVYIGQTTRNFHKRYGGDGIEGVYKYHKNYKSKGKCYNEHLLKSIEKYGFKNFKVSERFDVAFSKKELDIKERTYIDLFKSTNGLHGYNNKEGGSHGKHTEATKRKISMLQTGELNHSYGKKRTKETREKMRQACLGNKNHMYGRKGERHPRYGSTCEQNGKSKPCRCIETNVIYPCTAEATRQTGITHIVDVCLGKRKRAGGYTWEYINKS